MDKALKQRLVGASVLIALAVVVLPMLLSGRPDSEQQQTEQIELPARPDGLSFETRRFPLVEDTTTPQKRDEPAADLQPAPNVDTAAQNVPETVDVDPAPLDTGLQAEEQQAEGLPSVASVELPKRDEVDLPVTVQEPVQTGSPPGSGGRFAVQVASLGSDANARRLQSSLEGKGFKVISDKIESDVGRLNRIRVGPFDSEAEAIAAVKKIRSQVDGVSPRLVDLDPNATAQVISPSDPLVRWVVQLGSFGESSNAENLVKQVRAQGLSAYSERVSSSSGAAINRVRVGPFLEREDASKAQQSLKSSLSINGVVMSAD